MKKQLQEKKILFISPLPPPHYGSAMSSEMCLDILKNTKDFQVRNIKLNYSKEMSDIGHLNLSKIKGFFKVKKKIKKQIVEFNPDLIYFVPATSGLGLIRDFLFVKIIKKYKKRIFFHIRSRITDKDWKNPLFRKLYKKMFVGEEAIVLDKRLKKDLHGLIKEKKIFVLPNAIENEVSDKNFNKIIKRREKRKSFNILFLSNMDESKGWFRLLKACKLLKNKKRSFECNFVGAWPNTKEKKKFFEFVKRNNLRNDAISLGKKIGEEKNRILEKSDVLVFPTEYRLETFGRVILEGMMFGLSVMANGIASIPTTIEHGRTGFILKENTPEEIAMYIEKLTNLNLRKKMGIAGRKRFLQNYTLDKYKDKFLKIIKN